MGWPGLSSALGVVAVMVVRIIQGDARLVLPTLASGSVQCVVTSPPYYGLRDYGVAGQIGMEMTPAEYIGAMVEVFSEVRRVLANDGTCWLNLGDSYANDGKWGGETGGKQAYLDDANRKRVGREKRITGLKPKDLLMIPARVALALQADGWWLRSEIVWAKPNPMPESVTDRPTSSHEKIFLLTKSARYFWDADAIWETADRPEGSGNVERKYRIDAGGNPGHNGHQGFSVPWQGTTRNIRNVWTIATAPYAEAHFATFPPELAERCIKAGSRPGDTVLDPFAGAFTAPMVADRLGRDAIGIELSEAYCALARSRIAADAGMFADIREGAALSPVTVQPPPDLFTQLPEAAN
jgi:DNA modification methylase